MRSLEYRYGEGLRWREVMIGLSEDTVAAERRGLTPTRRLRGWQTFGKRFGMPVGLEPRTPHDPFGPGLPGRRLRARAESGAGDGAAAGDPHGLVHLDAAPRRGRRPARGRRGRARARRRARCWPASTRLPSRRPTRPTAPRRAARDANGRPAIVQEKTATAGEGERFTAPSLVFQRDGQRLVAGGWQPLHAYDVCVANLAPDLPRRPEPRVPEALAAFPGGLTTQEVARLCADARRRSRP